MAHSAQPVSHSWDDYGDAQTEMSVAPVKGTGVEAQSGGWDSRRPVEAAGYSAEELAALVEEEDGEPILL